MGKSSVASYMIEYAKVRYNMVGIHIYNDGVHIIDDLIRNIVEKLLNEVKNDAESKIIDFFKNNIETVGFLGNTLRLRKNDDIIIKDIKDSFDDSIVNTIRNLKNKNGLFIVIDDINGLSELLILLIGIKVLLIH